MATIKVGVKGEIATNLTPEIKLVCQNEKYTVEFEFDESWAGSTIKTALFIYNGDLIAIPFDGDVCKIPKLINTQLLHIGVKSHDNDVEGLHTTTPARVNCLLSADDLTSNEIPEPQKDVYDEIIALINNIDTGGMTKDELETLISDAQTNANNYTDEKVNQAVTDINTESIAPLQDTVDTHERKIATLQGEVKRVEGIAKGAQEGASYESYYDMVTVLNGGDKSLLKKHKSVYIGTDDVPDLWVYDIADTPKQYIYTSEEAFANDLIINKSVQVGYFIFKRLEFGKVDLENYYTRAETDDKLEEVKSASQVKIVRLI